MTGLTVPNGESLMSRLKNVGVVVGDDNGEEVLTVEQEEATVEDVSAERDALFELLDVVLDTTKVKHERDQESLGTTTMDVGVLCALGMRQVAIEDRMKEIARVVSELAPRTEGQTDSQFEADMEVKLKLSTCVDSVTAVVAAVTDDLIDDSGIVGDHSRYERAQEVWRGGKARE
jgi:hypothetical protein